MQADIAFSSRKAASNLQCAHLLGLLLRSEEGNLIRKIPSCKVDCK